MATNPEIEVDLTLNDLDFKRKVGSAKGQIDDMANGFKNLGRELSQVSRTMIFFGGAVTASVGGAFAQASKDIPSVTLKLKEVSNAFQVLSNNVAIAAMPSIDAFTRLLNGTVNAVSKFVLEHQTMINQFIKYSFIAVAVGTVGIALAKLLSVMNSIIKLSKAFIAVLTLANLQFLALTAVVAGLVIGLAFLSDKFLGTKWVKDFNDAISKMTGSFKKFMSDFEDGAENGVKRVSSLSGKFAEGFKSNFESLSESMQTFGTSVGAALETGLSTAIFDTFTGKIQGLRSLLIGFSNDVLKAFSKMLANQALLKLFGGKDGSKGLFSGVGAMLGFGGSGKSKVAEENTKVVRDNSRQFRDLTENMKLFGRAKDNVIDKFNKFTRGGVRAKDIVMDKFNNFTRGGVRAKDSVIDKFNKFTKGKGGGRATVSGIADNGRKIMSNLRRQIQELNKQKRAVDKINISFANMQSKVSDIGKGFQLNTAEIANMGATFSATGGRMVETGVIIGEMLVNTRTFVDAISQAFDLTSLSIKKMGITYIATQAIMVITSVVATAIITAVSVIAAQIIATAWTIPALLVSIATFGGAAAIGTASLGVAVLASKAIVSGANQLGSADSKLDTSNFSVGSGAYSKGATGGIVTRPTFALIGEAGPEAVIPLNQTPGSSPLGKIGRGGRGGSTNVEIHIDTAILDKPSNMREFVNLLKEELAR